jgi:transcription initiation factor TFIID subunit 6
MPTVLTCVVGKQLCQHPATDDHWAVRESAAALVGTVCRKYGDAFPTLQPRVAKTLLRALLDPLKPLPTHYGAIHGMLALGRPTVRLLLLPNVRPYMRLLEPQLAPDPASPVRALEARRCYMALLVRWR